MGKKVKDKDKEKEKVLLKIGKGPTRIRLDQSEFIESQEEDPRKIPGDPLWTLEACLAVLPWRICFALCEDFVPFIYK